MGVVFFPSLPFIGVMLFPSFRLGNTPGEDGASLALLSLFLILFLHPLFFLSSSLSPSPLLFSPSPLLFSPFSFLPFFHPFFFFSSFSFSSFLSFSPFPFLSSKLFCPLFLHSPLFELFPFFLFLLCLLLPSPAFFFLGGTSCTVCFQDVGDDATNCNLDCNPIVI